MKTRGICDIGFIWWQSFYFSQKKNIDKFFFHENYIHKSTKRKASIINIKARASKLENQKENTSKIQLLVLFVSIRLDFFFSLLVIFKPRGQTIRFKAKWETPFTLTLLGCPPSRRQRHRCQSNRKTETLASSDLLQRSEDRAQRYHFTRGTT